MKEIYSENRVTVLFLSWRDIKSPKAGGAEVYTHEMLKNADHDKYRFIHFSCGVDGLSDYEFIDGILYIREGSLLNVIGKAKEFYNYNKQNIDYVVDQSNTHQFFTPFWVEKEKRLFFIHQQTREIWFQQMSFPFSLAGYLLESPMLRLHRYDRTITVSNSTAAELIRIGFNKEKISILPEGLSFTPWEADKWEKKDEGPAFIYVGRYSRYKGINKAIIAFSEVKKQHRDAVLWLVGKPDNEYVKKVLLPLCSKIGLSIGPRDENPDVVIWGFVSEEKKLELMSRAKALIFPSVREGWGLIISEAAAVGTPSIVFDAPGTRDAVDYGNAGYMCSDRSTQELASKCFKACSNDIDYRNMQIKAYSYAFRLDWKKTGQLFTEFLNTLTYSKGGLKWVV